MSGNKVVLIGRIISVLVGLAFAASGVMKLMGPPEVAQGFAHLGLPESMIMPLGILEISCVIIYWIPMTSMVGAILLTGYMGGAICTHWRAGEPPIAQIIFPIVVWLGLYLRDNRVRSLIPIRKLS